MKASSESGEWATEIVRVSVSVGIRIPQRKTCRGYLELSDETYITPFDGVVDCVALDSFEAGVFDQVDQLAARHFDFIVGFNRITFGKLATFSYGAINVVSAIMKRNLRKTFSEHYPIGFHVIEVVQKQTRNGHCLERIHARRPRQVR